MWDGKRSCHAQKLVGGLHLSMFSCILISHPLILDSQLLIQPTEKLGVRQIHDKRSACYFAMHSDSGYSDQHASWRQLREETLGTRRVSLPPSHQLTRPQSQPDLSSHDMTPSLSRWSAEPLALRISLTTEQYSTKRCFADERSEMDGRVSYGRAEASVKQGRAR